MNRGLKELAMKAVSHHLGGGSSGDLGYRCLEFLRTSKASVAAEEQAGGRRWEKVSDLVGRGLGGSGSD